MTFKCKPDNAFELYFNVYVLKLAKIFKLISAKTEIKWK